MKGWAPKRRKPAYIKLESRIERAKRILCDEEQQFGLADYRILQYLRHVACLSGHARHNIDSLFENLISNMYISMQKYFR